MSKVIIFSRVFPAYHPKKGIGTFFIQKVLKSLLPPETSIQSAGFDLDGYTAKYHTIRVGERFKVGDTFSARIWTGKPYRSKQMEFCGPIEIKKVFKIATDGILWWIDNQPIHSDVIKLVAQNDGLEYEDFLDWFKIGKSFSGQIICWNDNIEY